MHLFGHFGIYELLTFGSIILACVAIFFAVLWNHQRVEPLKTNTATQTTQSADTFAQKWPVVTGKVDASRVTKKRVPPICKAYNDERR
jgi:hypothetical protein